MFEPERIYDPISLLWNQSCHSCHLEDTNHSDRQVTGEDPNLSLENHEKVLEPTTLLPFALDVSTFGPALHTGPHCKDVSGKGHRDP